MLMIGNRFGGNLLVATDRSGRYIGFSFAMPGWKQDKRRFWWSHMTAVIKEYRNRGVGLALKLRQREEALAAEVDRIEWTFDPMQAMNANFNVRKLGVIVHEYEENVYGYTSSPLHSGLPTDRFVAEWNLDSDHVRRRLDASEGAVILRDIDRMPIINPGGHAPDLSLEDSLLLLEIPADLSALKAADLGKAKQWQESVRKACLHYFHRGYAVTDFIRVSTPHPQALYVLER
jgi:predicted GNAT superfamily acetyltransferase